MTARGLRVSLTAVGVFYGAMLAIAGGVSWWLYDRLPLRVGDATATLPAKVGVGVAFGLLVVGASAWASRRTAWGKRMDARFAEILGAPKSVEAAYMAFTSGVAEEVLFRGLLIQVLGPVGSTLLFAAFHWDRAPGMWVWTVFALGVGAAMAAMTLWTGDVTAAILAHVTINYFNLLSIGQARR